MKVLALILAREGSVRLKNKNLKKINKKTLVERTIKIASALKAKKKICDILISTDSKKILSQSKNKKILAPWLRPEYLSKSSSTSAESALHAINWYESNIGKLDGILLLQPTTPYRSLNDLILAIDIFVQNKGKKKIISVSPIKNHHADIYTINNNNLSSILRGSKKIFSKESYVTNGSFYIIPINYLKQKKNFNANNSIPYVIKSKIFSIDIDDIYDFEISEVISKQVD